ncbi:MAG: hypothetical protein NTX61_07515 [Bacteroidetes bacterium]|nr:hypothetical protein [Bacteroidota bacterium]
MKKWFEMPLTAKIKEEQEALNMLVFQIQATNTNQKDKTLQMIIQTEPRVI